MKRQSKKGGKISDVSKAIINRQIAVGKLKKGDFSGIKQLLPNLSDSSLSQLDPSSDDFVPELYNMLTPEEQTQVKLDKLMTISNPANLIPFIGLFQDTREAVAETMGFRHPELLQKAIDRYNEKVKLDNELMAMQEKEYEDELKEYEKQKETRQIQDMISQTIKQNQQPEFNIPQSIVPTASFPIDPMRGRGLYGGNIIFQNDLYKRHKKLSNDYDLVKY